MRVDGINLSELDVNLYGFGEGSNPRLVIAVLCLGRDIAAIGIL